MRTHTSPFYSGFSPFLPLYLFFPLSLFFTPCSRAAKILKQKMKEDKKFGTFIRKKNREAGEGRDLQHFLIMPVQVYLIFLVFSSYFLLLSLSYLSFSLQRLPRYQLLLNELIKNTPVDHTDIECLKVALVKIRKVSSFLKFNFYCYNL